METDDEVTGIAAVFLAPFTVGESLIITDAGAEATRNGEKRYNAAKAADTITETIPAEDAHTLWKNFKIKFEGVTATMEMATQIFGAHVPESVEMPIRRRRGRANQVVQMETAIKENLRVPIETVGQKIARSVGMNFACLWFSIHELVGLAVEMHKQTKSKLGVPFRNIADELDKIAQIKAH
ncbi:hypothetical protein V1264_017221 [Littorina saxatilis]|uniref:Uncharacterized protein n=1 Tax=Littorina saxatilis TaxID=31220 RepID=A0AAN9BHS4_9CAEN